MTNEDLKRFYQNNPNIEEPEDFVRLDNNGKIGENILPDMPKRFIIEDIENIDEEIINLLKCGDIVIKSTSNSNHAYLVAYKKENEMSLVYTDHENVEEVYYEKSTTGWAHITTDITHIGN